MKNRKPAAILAVILMLSVINFTRIQGTEHIRLIEFLAIFSIGAVSALLIKELVHQLKSR